VIWADHLLYGVELPVHGWHHHDGKIQLFVTLPDGSRAYFPADRTALWETAPTDIPPFLLTGDAVRKLRLQVEALQARRGRRRPEERK